MSMEDKGYSSMHVKMHQFTVDDLDSDCSSLDSWQKESTKKQKVYKDKYAAEGEHIFLCFFNIPATEVFLHHLLVETCHDYSYKHPAEELLNKKSFMMPVCIEHF